MFSIHQLEEVKQKLNSKKFDENSDEYRVNSEKISILERIISDQKIIKLWEEDLL